MSSYLTDLTSLTKIHPEPLSYYTTLDIPIPNTDTSTSTSTSTSPSPPLSLSNIDHFDRIPDSLLLLVFNKIGDVKALGRCCVVSKRFHSLVPQVDNVVVRVDCVISDDDPSSSSSTSSVSSTSTSSSDKSRSFTHLFRIIFGNLFKPIQALSQLLGPKRLTTLGGPTSSSTLSVGDNHNNNNNNNNNHNDDDPDSCGVTHHSPTQVLKNFGELKFLRIELPSGELGIDDGVLLKWRADFGSTLDNCVILGASSVYRASPAETASDSGGATNSNGDSNSNSTGSTTTTGTGGCEDNGSIPESFYTNGGLKLRVVWTISSLIAASARHYLLQPIIAEHRTLDSLVLTDSDGQGVLCMNRDQLEELRVKPLSASSASKRTLVPALNMRLWYAPRLELPDGMVLKGATLVAIRPSEQSGGVNKKDISDLSWVSSAFEQPYGTAAKMLVKRRTYCLEMNSF